jgi:biotin operon repressor
MPKTPISITVDDDHLAAIETIVRTIEACGLQVERVVPEAGAIRAIGEEADLDTLRGIEGVMEAVPERGYRLPPMDRKIPQ